MCAFVVCNCFVIGRLIVVYSLVCACFVQDGLSLAKSVQSRRRCSRSLFELSCRGLAKPLSELALSGLLTAAAVETDAVTSTGLIAAAMKIMYVELRWGVDLDRNENDEFV